MWGTEIAVLVRKNVILVRRKWVASLLQVSVPVFLIVLLFTLNNLTLHDPNPTPAAFPLPSYERCRPGPSGSCLSLVWGPTDDANATSLVVGLQRLLRLPDEEMRGFGSQEELEFWVLEHPNITSSGVYFNSTGAGSLFRYTIYSNSSDDASQPTAVQAALDRLMVGAAGGGAGPEGDAVIEVSLQALAAPKKNVIATGVQIGGGSFFFCAIFFNVVVVLQQTVSEREKRLREGLALVGVSDISYWVALLIAQGLLCLVSTLLILATGYAVGFALFTKCSPVVLFLMFFAFAMGSLPFAFVLSCLVSRVRSALVVGVLLLVVGMNLTSFLLVQSLVYVFWSDDAKPWIRGLLQALFPPFNFAKIYSDVINITYGYTDAKTNLLVPPAHYSLRDLGRAPPARFQYGHANTAPPSWHALGWLAFNLVAFFALTWLLDVGGQRLGRWRLGRLVGWATMWRRSSAQGQVAAGMPLCAPVHPETVADGRTDGADVVAEHDRASRVRGEDVALRLVNLRKRFSGRGCCRRTGPVQAVDGLSLCVGRGEVVAVVGMNGSGKTTSIRVVSGLETATSGYAEVRGIPVAGNRQAVRRKLGVCPQHDILWDQLTCVEHVVMFARLKGSIPDGEGARGYALRQLARVELDDVPDRVAGALSGGMKRRLSALIATLGDLEVVILDEPTTGVDVAARLATQRLIQEEAEKRGLGIVLVTHSMEEASALADRVAILGRGRLQCIGSAVELRSRMQSGFTVRVTATEDGVVDGLMADLLDLGMDLKDRAGLTMVFVAQRAHVGRVCRYLEQEEDAEDGRVATFAVSDATLEDVYLATQHPPSPPE